MGAAGQCSVGKPDLTQQMSFSLSDLQLKTTTMPSGDPTLSWMRPKPVDCREPKRLCAQSFPVETAWLEAWWRASVEVLAPVWGLGYCPRKPQK